MLAKYQLFGDSRYKMFKCPWPPQFCKELQSKYISRTIFRSLSLPLFSFALLFKPVYFTSFFTYDPTQPVSFVYYWLWTTVFKSSRSRGHSVIISLETENLGNSAAFTTYEDHQSHCTKISSSGHVPLWFWALCQSLGISKECRNEAEFHSVWALFCGFIIFVSHVKGRS